MINAVFQSHRSQSLRVRYRIIGKGKRLLFLHGVWVDPFIFKELLGKLAETYEVLIPDIPPFGESRSYSILSLEEYAALFEELLESIGWRDIFAVGHSFGGGIALHLAVHSSRLQKVVVCNPIGIPFRKPEILAKYPLMIVKAVTKLAAEKNSDILQKILIDVGKVLLKNPIRPIAQTITQCLCEDEKILQKISIPVSVIWGSQDELLPVSYMEKIQQVVPQVKVLYIDGHHNWCLVNQKLAETLIQAELIC